MEGARVVTSEFLEGHGRPALIVLNWTLPPLALPLWPKASLRICADGGSNRLYDELPALLPGEQPAEVRARFLPDAITGDLDSVRPEVLEFYRSRGVPVADLGHDQESTDLQKCVAYVLRAQRAAAANGGAAPAPHAEQPQGEPPVIVALGAHGGRLDHMLGHLSTLCMHRHTDLVLLGDGNLSRLLRAGRSVVRPHRAREGPSCGLAPLEGRAVASSRGLRWNLDKTEMRFGGLISTSNIIDADQIEVESDSDLLWTTELNEDPGIA